jgi:hypothetical protein
VFLEDFQLLYNTRQDIHSKPWADPVARVAMKQAQRISRARDEIYNCNIDVRQLHTHLLDETYELQQISRKLKAQGHPVAGAVKDFVIRRSRINIHLLNRVDDIHNIKGFTGSKTPGIRVGKADWLADQLAGDLGFDKEVPVSNRDLQADDALDDDEVIGEYGGLVDYVCDMPVSK